MAIGYACQAIGVPGAALSGCSLKNASEENLRNRIRQNLSALEAMLDYNYSNHIHLFRISSDIIPFGSHPVNTLNWWEDYRDILETLGEKIRSYGIRVSMHPGQYTVLNSKNPEVVERSVLELIYHARLLDALGADQTNKLILHIGGSYGNKPEAARSFVREYNRLPQEVKQRLVIENDEHCFHIGDVLKISDACKAPVVFDNLHHRLHRPGEECSEQEWIKRCQATWSGKDGKQKLHYSQQKEKAAPGSHSDFIVLAAFRDFCRMLGDLEPDIMLEVKDKNLSAVKCINTVLLQRSGKELEAEWERYELFILSKSKEFYQKLPGLLEIGSAKNADEFYEGIEQAFLLPEDRVSQCHAARSIWRYLCKNCSVPESRRYERLLEAYAQGNCTLQPLKNHLLRCALKQGEDRLIHSLYFYL